MSDVKTGADVQIDACISDEGLSFRPSAGFENLTYDQVLSYNEATVIKDSNGPTTFFLDLLSKWPMNYVDGLVKEIQSVWEGGSLGCPFSPETRQWVLNTNKDPANESIIMALTMNAQFWESFWVSATRYGVYSFDLRLPLVEQVSDQ